MQGTVATFSPDTRTGTVFLDDGTSLPFPAEAFIESGLRLLRLGQRVKLRVEDGRVVALAHIAQPLGVQVRYTGPDRRPRWQLDVEPLGRDSNGRWFGARRGIQRQLAGELPVVQPHDCVLLVPARGSFVAVWNADGPLEVSVDVTSRPVVEEHTVTAVDCDLDVVRFRDGRVEVLGVASCQVDEALATAAALVEALSAGTEPFGSVGQQWLASFRASPR